MLRPADRAALESGVDDVAADERSRQSRRQGDRYAQMRKSNSVTDAAGYSRWVDQYRSRQGDGYVIHIQKQQGESTYHKVVNVGPHGARSLDWHEVEALTPPPVFAGGGGPIGPPPSG